MFKIGDEDLNLNGMTKRLRMAMVVSMRQDLYHLCLT
jgi:hypothetical protein